MRRLLSRLVPKLLRRSRVTIPVVRLSGVIASGGSALRPSLSLAGVASQLDRAFAMKSAPAVALLINSPGGSPVQSRQIYARIKALARENDKRVIAFVEDVAASGGYLIALAADEIYADPSSIVGSIGVVSGTFGFPELLKKIGIERRVHTAGENKSILDPFQPEKERDVEILKSLQLEMHKVFIDLVKESRGKRLTDHPDLFTGLFWTGGRAVELGLIDGLADLREEMRRRYGDKVKLELMTGKRDFFGRPKPGLAIGGEAFAAAAGAGAAEGLLQALEEKAITGRYGF